MKNKTRVLVLALFSIAVLSACSKSGGNPPPPVKNNLLYIYRNDSTDGVAFKNLLQGNGCSVTLIDKSFAATLDYSTYNMIVIGSNTDTLPSASSWSPADAIAINNSGKPFLFIGEGGLLFANRIQQDTVNWESSAGNTLASFSIVDSGSVLYKKPKTIPIPANLQLTIYSVASKVVSFYAKSTPVHNVVLVGQETDVPGSKYYSVTIAGGRYGAFGFYGNVNTMTSTGKDYLVNLVYYVGSLAL